jgi:hypothetical protein
VALGMIVRPLDPENPAPPPPGYQFAGVGKNAVLLPAEQTETRSPRTRMRPVRRCPIGQRIRGNGDLRDNLDGRR